MGALGFVAGIAPPFAVESLRSVRAGHAEALAPPDEHRGRVVGEHGRDVDRLERRQHAAGAGEIVVPDRAGGAGEGGGGADRSLRHRAGARGGAIEAVLAEAIGERIDKGGEVGTAACQAFKALALPGRHRFHQRRHQCHRLDPEAGVDGFQLG